MKSIVLAGGAGTRLLPFTKYLNKHLLPIYNKPMIFYSINTMKDIGIKEFFIITTKESLTVIQDYLRNEIEFQELQFFYCIQKKPAGLAQAFILAEDFIENESIALILGDNIFFSSLKKQLSHCLNLKKGAEIVVKEVTNPKAFGVMNLNDNNEIISLEEKPQNPKSNLAIVGLYFYDNKVIDYAKNLKPSARGELEITDINKIYLEQDNLNYNLINSDWLDCGSFENLVKANHKIYNAKK